ncbi:MAG: hypothetical protein AAGK01_03965 [Pseudomonadota bacterium]
MTETKSKSEVSFMRKLVIPMIAGGLAGFAVSFGIIFYMDGAFGSDASISREIAAIVGGLYLVIAIGVGVGAASPALGEKYLNTDDAEEILEMRTVLMNSAAAMTLWGVALIVLALAAPAGPIPVMMALVSAIVLFVAGSWLAWRSHKASDELFAAVNIEASMWAYVGTVLIGGSWMVGAHLQLVPALAPIDWLTLFYVVALAASFIASGRRGMLKIK